MVQTTQNSSYIILTPAGVFEAFSQRNPSEIQSSMQALLSAKTVQTAQAWQEKYGDDSLNELVEQGLVQYLEQELTAPNLPLDKFLPYVVASLSGTRKAAIGSNEGFCLARIGYSQEEAETLSVAAADFFDFFMRQEQRGWAIKSQAMSFFGRVDLLMPDTSFVFLWIDGAGYVLILDSEPLTNNRAFVELIWAIKTSGLRFEREAEVQ
ncbi:MAG: hypothetical protein Q4G13_03090 [Moraxella sp.]|nr:hypothetical protein [Moraxella sp.]